MHYRNEARKALGRAKLELDSSEDHRLRYAALELRMALEGLIYEKASSYKAELSGKILSTWQPKKLLNLLLAVCRTFERIDVILTLHYKSLKR